MTLYYFAPGNDAGGTIQDVFCHHTSDVHRVFGRRIGGSIGVFYVSQLIDGLPSLYGSRKQVNAFVYSIEAHDLGTQEFTISWRKGNLEGHGLRTGVIAGMRRGMDRRVDVGYVQTLQ
ncbi:MAG: hypothetical protein BWY72_01632 [Bacteroidetes bacterium ADurb.Bin416]|nr:MAG: hypothetical protein BWY72_01632 [Bacteroidetes bacterium ADurb.Bin416]